MGEQVSPVRELASELRVEWKALEQAETRSKERIDEFARIPSRTRGGFRGKERGCFRLSRSRRVHWLPDPELRRFLMRPVGFSTGALAKGDFRRALQMLKGKGCPAVELSALREPELEPLVEAAPSLELTGFEYVSVHAPSKILGSEHDIVAKLETLAALGWPIIVHPDVIQDFTAWRKLGRSVVIENMDMRKPTGRHCSELEAFFARLPEARFCLDVGHARQVDPTMSGAAGMMHLFGDRLVQLHVSEVNTRSGHEALSLGSVIAFNKISHLIPDEIPLILETPASEVEISTQIQMALRALPHHDAAVPLAR